MKNLHPCPDCIYGEEAKITIFFGQSINFKCKLIVEDLFYQKDNPILINFNCPEFKELSGKYGKNMLYFTKYGLPMVRGPKFEKKRS